MTIDWKIHTYASLSSTQDYVRELAEEGFDEGVVIQALTQTKGRGRHGNTWSSLMGNLHMSLLLRPDCTAEQAGQLSFVTAVAVSAAMDSVVAEFHTKTLKWPNDILIRGKKVSGILLESELEGDKVKSLVLGIGVNIMAAPEDRICLQEVSGGVQIAVHPFRDRLLAELGRFYAQWQKEGFAPIRDLWLAQAHGLGETITARLPEGREETGIFKGLDENGFLILEEGSGKTLAVSAGEILSAAVS